MAQENYFFRYPDLKSAQLPEEELQKALDLYYSGISITEIQRLFPVFKQGAFKHHVPYTPSDRVCDKCEAQAYERKVKVSGNSFEMDYYCSECQHDFTADCSCEICDEERKERQRLERERFERIWHRYIQQNFGVVKDIGNLSVFDEIHIYMICKRYYNQQLQYFDFGYDCKNSWNRAKIYAESPYRNTILKFIERQLFKPSAEVESDVLRFYNDEIHLNYTDQFEIPWVLNINHQGEIIDGEDFMNYIENKGFSDEEKFALWKHIYSVHIYQYIDQLADQQLQLDIDILAMDFVVEGLIYHFSLSKAFCIIYMAMGSALRYKVSYKADKRKTTTYFMNKVQEFSERFRNDKTLKEFNRPAYIESPSMTDFVMKKILKVSVPFFYTSIKEILPEIQAEAI